MQTENPRDTGVPVRGVPRTAADNPPDTVVQNSQETVAQKASQPKTAAKKKSRGAVARRSKHTLLIVESPAKGKTIEKYLGKGYTVAASMGHLIDLPKSRLAIDVEDTFEPEYITVRGKAKILKDLKQQAKKADAILLASDNDREGEAISFHLRNSLQNGKAEKSIQTVSYTHLTLPTILLV